MITGHRRRPLLVAAIALLWMPGGCTSLVGLSDLPALTEGGAGSPNASAGGATSGGGGNGGDRSEAGGAAGSETGGGSGAAGASGSAGASGASGASGAAGASGASGGSGGSGASGAAGAGETRADAAPSDAQVRNDADASAVSDAGKDASVVRDAGTDAKTNPCDLGLTLCGSTCFNLQTNAQHCGTCDRTCGDVCSAGRCGKVLYSGSRTDSHLAVDATYVYWSASQLGELWRVPKAGGTPERVVTGQTGPYAVAVDAYSLYWSNRTGGSIMKWPLTGGTPVTVVANEDSPAAIAIDGNNLYWIGTDFSASGWVKKVPLGGGAPLTLASGSDLLNVNDLAIDGTYAYLAIVGPTATGSTAETGSLMKVPLAGGSTTTIATRTKASKIAINATTAFFAHLRYGIDRVPLTGGTPTSFAQNFPEAIAVDTTGVYIVSENSVLKYPLAGGDPAVLATLTEDSLAVSVGSLVVDDTQVYWGTTDGLVHSTSKVP